MGGVESTTCGGCTCGNENNAPEQWEPPSSRNESLPLRMDVREADKRKEQLMRLFDKKFREADSLEGLSNAPRARAAFEELINLYGTNFGFGHPKVGSVHFALGGVAYDSDDFVKAKGHYEHALKIGTEAIESASDPEKRNSLLVANCCNLLGMTHYRLGDFDQAQRYYNTSLKMKQGFLGQDHTDIANIYNNLGALACDRGNLDEARTWYCRDLDIMIKQHGPSNLDIIESYINLGHVAFRQNDFEGAKGFYWRALDIQKAKLGSNNLACAKTYINLAMVVEEQRVWDDAHHFYSEALDIQILKLGQAHPDVVRTSADVALMEARKEARRKGGLRTSKMLYKKALELYDDDPQSVNDPRVATAEAELEEVVLRLYQPGRRRKKTKNKKDDAVSSQSSNASTTSATQSTCTASDATELTDLESLGLL
jgi:tetratricopeptide (TPR) repeat protein